jgi:transcriptional regulator GlxA family with amidase domain
MRLAVLAYDGISPFMLSTPLAVFGEPFVASGHGIDVCARNRRFSATGGLSVETQHALESCRDSDIVILPGWRNADETVPSEIVSELRGTHSRGAIVVGLCLGAFGLAEAGLLDGRRATTHWARAETFANRYPEVEVDAGALFVDEGQVLTSAGIASGLDCCLHLLARISGVMEANRVARHLVVAPQRSGGQPQLIDRPTITSSADHRINDILEALRAAPAARPDLDELARQAGMSRRSVTRHIRERTGGSLGDWLKQARLARAQELLAGGSHSIQSVADLSGFPDAQALRTAFRTSLGLTPKQWLARQRLA